MRQGVAVKMINHKLGLPAKYTDDICEYCRQEGVWWVCTLSGIKCSVRCDAKSAEYCPLRKNTKKVFLRNREKLMKLRKGEKLIQVGEFGCIINKYGGLVNVSRITVWSKQNARNYIKFLEELMPYLEGE